MIKSREDVRRDAIGKLIAILGIPAFFISVFTLSELPFALHFLIVALILPFFVVLGAAYSERVIFS